MEINQIEEEDKEFGVIDLTTLNFSANTTKLLDKNIILGAATQALKEIPASVEKQEKIFGLSNGTNKNKELATRTTTTQTSQSNAVSEAVKTTLPKDTSDTTPISPIDLSDPSSNDKQIVRELEKLAEKAEKLAQAEDFDTLTEGQKAEKLAQAEDLDTLTLTEKERTVANYRKLSQILMTLWSKYSSLITKIRLNKADASRRKKDKFMKTGDKKSDLVLRTVGITLASCSMQVLGYAAFVHPILPQEVGQVLTRGADPFKAIATTIFSQAPTEKVNAQFQKLLAEINASGDDQSITASMEKFWNTIEKTIQAEMFGANR